MARIVGFGGGWLGRSNGVGEVRAGLSNGLGWQGSDCRKGSECYGSSGQVRKGSSSRVGPVRSVEVSWDGRSVRGWNGWSGLGCDGSDCQMGLVGRGESEMGWVGLSNR